MKFSFIDNNVSTTMNVFLVLANIINLFYNIPQMVTTYKRKSTKDFSTTFLVLRIVGNVIWIGYAIEVNSLLMLINNVVTVLSSIFIGYYKALEIIADYKKKKEGFILPLNNIDNIDNNSIDEKNSTFINNDNNTNTNTNITNNNIENSTDNDILYDIDIHNDDKNKLIK